MDAKEANGIKFIAILLRIIFMVLADHHSLIPTNKPASRRESEALVGNSPKKLN